VIIDRITDSAGIGPGGDLYLRIECDAERFWLRATSLDAATGRHSAILAGPLTADIGRSFDLIAPCSVRGVVARPRQTGPSPRGSKHAADTPALCDLLGENPTLSAALIQCSGEIPAGRVRTAVGTYVSPPPPRGSKVGPRYEGGRTA
jgi:hypothetical protein